MSGTSPRGTTARGTRTSRAAVVMAYVALAGLLLFDKVEGPGEVIGLIAALPALAAAVARPLPVAVIGSSGLLAAWLYGVHQEFDGTAGQQVRLAAILVVSVVSVGVAEFRQRREVRLLELTVVADVLRSTVLRPLPARVGGVPVAVRYSSSDALALVGGDLYEVLDTPYGVRAVLGDVRGKGLGTLRLGTVVLGAFREAAHRERDLVDVAAAMDAAVRREAASEEDFVTAVLVEVCPDVVALASCGHPAPLLLPPSGPAREAGELSPAAPLGMAERPAVARLPRVPGERLLLFSDGVSEARRRGEFFPLASAATDAFSGQGIETGLERLHAALRRFAGGSLDDDAALVVLQL